MDILALYNIKGGVGKTAAAVNLAYLAARDGHKTILCDLDPQASASYYLRIRPSKRLDKRKLLKGGDHILRNIKGTDFENLDFLPSAPSYRNLDIELAARKRPRRTLGDVLRPLKQEYSTMFLDCPPNITLVSENVFRAVDYLVVPLIPTTLSMLAYSKLVRFFKRRQLNLSKVYPFFSMVERRKKMHREILDGAPSLGGQFLTSHIPYSADVEKMGLHRRPVACDRPSSPAALAYQKLWDEIKQVRSRRES
ncbi:MAG: AAA family ATPase [Candidatus Latescibacteria bacterium]|nr:AAA family ATPase [Candidatus Latescibacterota bacterium]